MFYNRNGRVGREGVAHQTIISQISRGKIGRYDGEEEIGTCFEEAIAKASRGLEVGSKIISCRNQVAKDGGGDSA